MTSQVKVDQIQANTAAALTINDALIVNETLVVTGDVTIAGGTITGITDLAVADGGTGASTAANALINLGLTATAAELNALDGITSSVAELNILDGVTSSAAELNILDGATLTVTELNFVDGVTSAIQTQLDQKLTLSAEQATTSGTSIDFTSIPSWVKEIKVLLHGVSANGAANYLVQLGDAGGIENTGYTSHAQRYNNGPATTNATATDGLILGAAMAAANEHIGIITLCLQDSTNNVWISTGQISDGAGTELYSSVGAKALSATLDRVRLTTVGGTATFDLGAVSISYR